MTAKMETPFYHGDAPAAVRGFGQITDYECYQENNVTISKRGVSSVGGHHFPGGVSGAMKLVMNQWGGAGNHNNLGLTSGTNNTLMVATASSLEDMNLLKLASPDLEHLIIQSNQGLVTTSSMSHSTKPFIYRSQATNEQEGFADGFVKALADLHKQNQLVGVGAMSPSSSSSSMQASYQRNLMSAGSMPIYTNFSSYNPPLMAYSGGEVYCGGGGGRALEAPQTVPEVPHPPGDPTASPPSLSPIDLETQERIKAEHKKLRNRIAASKCRMRKLERISRLEERVKVLKGQNSDLASSVAMLREQVAQLKQKVMSHVISGCQITIRSTATAKSSTGRGGAGGSRDFPSGTMT